MREWTLREWTMQHHVARVDSAGVDNAAPCGKGGQCGSGQCRSGEMRVKCVTLWWLERNRWLTSLIGLQLTTTCKVGFVVDKLKVADCVWYQLTVGGLLLRLNGHRGKVYIYGFAGHIYTLTEVYTPRILYIRQRVFYSTYSRRQTRWRQVRETIRYDCERPRICL